MAVTFGEVWSHLVGLINPLSSTFARDIVNQMREDLYAQKEWGFLHTEGFLRVPALINVGTVSVTKYSRNIIVSSEVKTIIDAIGIDDIPIENRQIKLTKFEYEYTIKNWDSTTSTLTLNDIYLGETDANAKYQIYKRFLLPPEYVKPDGNKIIDFARFIAIVDAKYQYRLDFDFSLDTINSADPVRLSEGNPYALIPSIEDSNGNPMFELYPALKDKKERIYKILYLRKGYNFTEDEEKFPNIFSKSLLIAAAKNAAFEWAQINRGKYPTLQKTNFENLIAINLNKSNPRGYSELLDAAFKRDEEQFPNALLSTYSSYPMHPALCDGDGYYGMNETLVTHDGVMRFRF